MKPTNLVAAIFHAIKINRPLFISGAPGIGKSAIVAAVVATIRLTDPDFQLADVRTALYQAVDIKGMPTVDLGQMIARWTMPDFFRLIKPGSRGILFLDEITAARPEVQAALYELVYDRRIGEYSLPEGWRIIAAGNRTSDRAVAFQMSTALASRFIQVDLDVDFDDFREWALDHEIDHRVLGFLKLRPTLLHNFDPATKARAFACPRTWEYVSDAVKAGLDSAIEFDVIAGLIGEGAATEFIGTMRLMDSMPDPDDVMADPSSAAVPDQPAVLYALAVCLSRLVDKASAKAFFIYADRLPGDFSVLMVNQAIKKTPAIQKTAGFIGWAAKHADVLI